MKKRPFGIIVLCLLSFPIAILYSACFIAASGYGGSLTGVVISASIGIIYLILYGGIFMLNEVARRIILLLSLIVMGIGGFSIILSIFPFLLHESNLNFLFFAYGLLWGPIFLFGIAEYAYLRQNKIKEHFMK